jgi:DNA ligase D-like protein (predicted 3'-phosphoesterase)
MPQRPVFVLHDHREPQPHFDLRLEEDGVLRSWAVPKGLPPDEDTLRLAVAVPDHALGHARYSDATKSIADSGWWELHDRSSRRFVFTLHGQQDSVRYALIRTKDDWLLRRVRELPAQPSR